MFEIEVEFAPRLSRHNVEAEGAETVDNRCTLERCSCKESIIAVSGVDIGG